MHGAPTLSPANTMPGCFALRQTGPLNFFAQVSRLRGACYARFTCRSSLGKSGVCARRAPLCGLAWHAVC